MQTLKKIIRGYMYRITLILVTAIFLLVFIFQLYQEHKSAYEGSLISFFQIEQILKENQTELSYIFSMLRVNPQVDYYAIDPETEEIVGSTKHDQVGQHSSQIGLTMADIKNTDAFHSTVNGHHSFCTFKQIDGNYIGRIVSSEVLYQRIPLTMALLVSIMLLVAFLLATAVIRHTNKYVVNEIQDVNEKLQSITNGNFEETINIQSSVEFSELSSYLNLMISSLLENSRKMSHILNKTNLSIGIYEYNTPMQKIHFTEHIPEILALTPAQENLFSMDISAFTKFLDTLRRHPVEDEEGVYQNSGRYIRLEEIVTGQDVFGVAIDITSEINKRHKIENERDMDMLTGLYNRRGFEGRLADLYPSSLKHSILIVIDADGLKIINDTYGHEKGDIYLKSIAEILRTFGKKNSIASRMGGDEFVLFLYGYDRWEALQKEIDNLLYIQSHHTVQLDKDTILPVRFSMGYCFSHGTIDYQQLFKEADERMYQNKLDRKKKA